MNEWWRKQGTIPLKEDNFQKIIDFYLFMCPVEIRKGSKKQGSLRYIEVSKRAKTFRSKGWTGSALNTLLATMKKTSSRHLEYGAYDANCKIDDICANAESLSSLADEHFEMIIISKRSDMGITSAIFYCIRNALAHGSFSVVGSGDLKTYYMYSERNGSPKGYIRLREKTLLNYIRLFNSPVAKL